MENLSGESAGKIYAITVFCYSVSCLYKRSNFATMTSCESYSYNHPLHRITYNDRNFTCNSINMSAGHYNRRN